MIDETLSRKRLNPEWINSEWINSERIDAEILSLEEAQALYTAGDAAHDFDHVLRVTQMAIKLAQAEGANVTVVRLAALLHDVPVHALLQMPAYKGILSAERQTAEETRTTHHLQAADFARAFLLQRQADLSGTPVENIDRPQNFSVAPDRSLLDDRLDNRIGNEMIEAIVHCIQAHRFRDRSIQPQTLEAKCLYDADKLDSIGAIGVARAFAYAGGHHNRLWTTPWMEIARGKEQVTATCNLQPATCTTPSDYTPVHEFVYKLRVILDTFYTQSARHIGEARHQRMVEFFSQLDEEMAGM